MGNKEKEHQTSARKKLLRLNNTQKTVVKYGGIIIGTAPIVSGVYGFLKDRFHVDMLSYFQSDVVAFLMIVVITILIASFIVFIFDHNKRVAALSIAASDLKESKKEIEKLKCQISGLEVSKKQIEEQLRQENSTQFKNDSIMDMLTYANANKQYREVIKIGTAVGDVLWSISRKELRIAVGEKVRAAASALATSSTNISDIDDAKRIEAKTLIEDIGNTKMCLDTDNVDEAIKDIEEGITIAEDNGYHFEAIRGHRNLANCYALMKNFDGARNEVSIAQKAIEQLSDPKDKAMAEFDVTYANVKISKDTGKHAEAIALLDHCIDIYINQLTQDQAARQAYADRLVKIYREKGVIYNSMPGMQNKAREAFEQGLTHAKDRQNHEDTVRCCTHLIELQTKYRFAGLDNKVPHWIKDAEENIPMVDTQKHIDAYRKAAKEWKNTQNGTKKKSNKKHS